MYQLNPGNYTLAGGAVQLSIPLTWTDAANGVTVEKTYRFKRGSYRIAVETRVINRGVKPVALPTNGPKPLPQSTKPLAGMGFSAVPQHSPLALTV